MTSRVEDEARWKRLQDLFDLAVSLDPNEREHVLASRCHGDPELFREVLDMIRADGTAKAASAPARGASSGESEPYHPGARIGHYDIEGRIGKGGMGIVYKARDTRLDRTVALKCLPLHLSGDSISRQRFVLEAKSASRLDHNNICVIHDIGDGPNGDLFLTMPFYEGETLDKRIARGALPLTEAMSISAQICAGLSAAHAEGIVHRDIKPSNLLVTTTGVVKILDFGLAKMGRLEMTQSGFRVGTLAYMAPERLAGQEVDQRADLWALGVVMFELLTGERPLSAVTFAVGADEETRPFLTPSKLRPQLPAALDAVLGKVLAPHPGARHRSADELIEDLRSACGYSRGKPADPAASRQDSEAAAAGPDSADAAWTTEQLGEMIEELTRRIGPIAPVLVKKASSKCSDWSELCLTLARELPSEDERQTFLSATSRHASSGGESAASRGRGESSVAAGLQLSDSAARQIARALSCEIGPIASELIARRQEMDATVEILCRSLAEFIDDRESRTRFLAKVGNLW